MFVVSDNKKFFNFCFSMITYILYETEKKLFWWGTTGKHLLSIVSHNSNIPQNFEYLHEFLNMGVWNKKLRGSASRVTVPLNVSWRVKTIFVRVPDKFAPTLPGRGWIVPIMHESNPWWSTIVAIVPAILGRLLYQRRQ